MALADPDQKTVLIADDDDWTREMLALLLEDEGLVPLEAGTGPTTIDVASAHRPDVILLDISMPGRSGLDVLESLRTRRSTPDIPVLLFSGEINLLETGHAHDADGAFNKPLDFGAFVEKVHEITQS
jgi:CheY-like chemotaxis protein